ncbi:hypothetical protein, partial [Alistipes putredinis]|uniref:hypothetical protein n=1 Tax=Alistipes putredinis TaxID=28117 RepID=UPI003A83AB43
VCSINILAILAVRPDVSAAAGRGRPSAIRESPKLKPCKNTKNNPECATISGRLLFISQKGE